MYNILFKGKRNCVKVNEREMEGEICVGMTSEKRDEVEVDVC
jgi:hypothetical protein